MPHDLVYGNYSVRSRKTSIRRLTTLRERKQCIQHSKWVEGSSPRTSSIGRKSAWSSRTMSAPCPRVELRRKIVIVGKWKITPTDIEHGFTRLLEEPSTEFQERVGDAVQRSATHSSQDTRHSADVGERDCSGPSRSPLLIFRTTCPDLPKESDPDRVFTAWLREL